MGLTESKLKDLKDKKFDKLFERHVEEWTEITKNAVLFARDNICQGQPPRADDVLKVLLPMVEPNEKLRKHQEENRAKFKHYREAFAEYLIDKYFQEHVTKERPHARRQHGTG